MVAFPFMSEEDIKINYNNLLHQFRINEKYMELDINEVIPDKEWLSLNVRKKRYQASFSYLINSQEKQKRIIEKEASYLFGGQIFTKAQKEDFIHVSNLALLQPEKADTLYSEFWERVGEGEKAPGMQAIVDECTTDDELFDDELFENKMKNKLGVAALFALDSVKDGSVWFMINSGLYDKYQILLYYDNLNNRPKGEDL